jgi:hypothetical protein
MNNLWKYLLAGTTLPSNQYTQVGGGHLHGYINSPVQTREGPYDPKSLFDLLYIHVLSDKIT